MSDSTDIDKKEESDLGVQAADDASGQPVPPEILQFLKNAPPEIRKTITQMAAFQFSGPVRHENPLFRKFTPQHIDKLLDYLHEDEKKQCELESSGRFFNLAYALTALGVFVFLVVFLAKDKPELFVDILKMLVAFAGGFGGGFGIKSYLDRHQ